MKLILLACLIGCAFGAPQRMSAQHERLFSPMKIVGGTEATLGQFPHQISFQILNGGSYMHYCGGSILDPETIITAAHCLQSGVPDSNTRVVAGITKIDEADGGQTIQVARSISHPDFSMFFDIVNDIGILKLSQPLELNENVKPIVIAGPLDTPSTADKACIASGWGNENIGQQTSNELKFVEINFIDDDTCVDMWSSWANVFPEQNICAGTTDGSVQSVCQGDSGGPLICEVEGGAAGEKVLFGATSWGSGQQCGDPAHPAVWTQVPFFIDWITAEAGIKMP